MDQQTKITMKELADAIMAVYDAYEQSGRTRMKTADDLRTTEMDLEATQDAILLDPDGPIDGKNAEIRAAQLRARTEDQYLGYLAAKNRYQQAVMDYELRYELLRTMRCLSSIHSGTSHA